MAYSVTAVTGATAYIWTLPDGWTQVTDGTTNTITVQPSGAAGNLTISVAATNGCASSAPVSIAVSYQAGIPMPEFATRNLGADPTYNDPKSQMQYRNTAITDGRLSGGLFQWGRDNKGNYAISADGNYTINNNMVGAANIANPVYDANGQIVTNNGVNAGNLFIVDNTNGQSEVATKDWRTPLTNSKGLAFTNSLWGNGVGFLDGPTDGLGFADPGILRSDGRYYQSTSWVMPQNNPCPSGYRVPTQDEWERYVNYECDGQNTAGGAVSVNANMLWGNTNTGFTWVRVANEMPSLTWTATVTDNNGYAVYRTDDWNAAIAAGGYFAGLLQNTTAANIPTILGSKKLSDAGAPTPVLFLPTTGSRAGNTPATGTQIGQIVNKNIVGLYYTSSVYRMTGTQNSSLYFTATSIYGYPGGTANAGFGIRCVKDPSMPVFGP
jgi:uncharacterized protein (TIGR02145 family)